MIKKIITLFILILIFANKYTYATDEIISSQMEALNLSSFIEEGQSYTKDVFPDMDLNSMLNSALKGEVDNKSLFTRILSIFGDELVSAISLLGTILVVIIIHSLLRSFTENLNQEGISQIAYYVEYILIVTLIMANFTNIINMIKDSISNLVGFINCIIPILLALMAASRKRCICFTNSATNNFYYSFYRKYYHFIYFASYTYCHNFRNSI